jgi:hypothetical protein
VEDLTSRDAGVEVVGTSRYSPCMFYGQKICFQVKVVVTYLI